MLPLFEPVGNAGDFDWETVRYPGTDKSSRLKRSSCPNEGSLAPEIREKTSGCSRSERDAREQHGDGDKTRHDDGAPGGEGFAVDA
jgi:hypothetical protein